jgi:4-hydroxybenzoate polyprenyltransferase
MHSDIDLENLIFKNTPPWTHPYIKLARMDRPIGTWLLLLPGLWAIALANGGVFNMSGKAWLHAELFAMGAFLMRSSGCVINDLWDMKLDAAVERTKTRPLASGEITRDSALRFLVALLLPAFFILLCFNGMTIALGVLSLPLVATYPYMKRVTWWPQAFLGLTFNWGALMGWTAETGSIGLPALLLYAGGIFWTLAYDTIYAHQDIEDDAVAGIKSTARLFGAKSKTYVSAFYALALALIFIAKLYASPGPWMVLLFLPACWQVWRVIRGWNPDSPQSSLAAFRAGRIVGWLLLLMLGI